MITILRDAFYGRRDSEWIRALAFVTFGGSIDCTGKRERERARIKRSSSPILIKARGWLSKKRISTGYRLSGDASRASLWDSFARASWQLFNDARWAWARCCIRCIRRTHEGRSWEHSRNNGYSSGDNSYWNSGRYRSSSAEKRAFECQDLAEEGSSLGGVCMRQMWANIAYICAMIITSFLLPILMDERDTGDQLSLN